jgi:hypothetical protein
MMKNIVVIRAGALGDVILTLPALQALRLRYPDASLRVVGYPALWQIAGSLIDAVISIDAPMFAGLFTGSPSDQLCHWLRELDLVVAWTAHDPRPALDLCGVPHVIHASPYPPPGVHASDWLIDSVERQQGSRGGASRSLLALTPGEMECGREILAAMELKHPIAIHPGAGALWKRWPAERFAALAQELARQGRQVVLVEGPADATVVAEVRQRLGGEMAVLRALPLRILAAVLAQCALYIGNDSGVTHLAATAGAPVLALFGPTDPVSWGPRGRDPHAIRILRACQRKATCQGQVRVCDDSSCMAGIEVSAVLHGVETLLVNVQNPVENPRFSVDNFVDPPSNSEADAHHQHFDTPSSGDAP